MKTLITGSEGFIGSHLKHLDYRPFDLKVGNNVRDYEDVESHMAGCDRVIHLASIAGVDNVIKSPIQTMETIWEGTKNVIDACMQLGTKRMINVSTSEVYGQFAHKVSEGEATSMGPVGNARWTYSSAKLAIEHLCMHYYEENMLPVVSVRPFNVFGPGQHGPGAVKNFVSKALANEDIVIKNGGNQIRSWCHIDDFIDGLTICLEHELAPGNVFNIGNPRNTCTIYDLALRVKRICASRSQIIFDEVHVPDVEQRIPNIDKLFKLGFKPKVSLDESIMRMIGLDDRSDHPRYPGGPRPSLDPPDPLR